MKTSLKFLMILIALFTIRCTEENIEPAQVEEDLTSVRKKTLLRTLTTHIQAHYPSSVFAIELTTIAGGHMEDPSLPGITDFYLSGPNGTKLSINWGDGTIQKVTLTGAGRDYFEHEYARVKNYNIQITGEISKITTFGLYYQNVLIRNVYLAGLVNLTVLSIGLNSSAPSVVNLSHNRKIEYLSLAGNVTDIIIPSENRLKIVELTGLYELSTAVVDRIISRVYNSVQATPRAGIFNLEKVMDETNDMVGPPSSYSMTKLKKLRDVYGWEITPVME